ncbi:MAG: hypothetical protein ACYTG3_15475 [Planctomycetota bacterium]|jgi:hypothetical protein
MRQGKEPRTELERYAFGGHAGKREAALGIGRRELARLLNADVDARQIDGLAVHLVDVALQRRSLQRGFGARRRAAARGRKGHRNHKENS